MMYSVAVYEYDNTCKTVYTCDKCEAVELFRNSVGACVKVVLYHGCYIVGEWDGTV